MTKPKFEKVDAHIIRIIVEKANEVPLAQLLENRKKLLEQKEQLRKDVLVQEKMIDQTIQNIDEILAEAKKLGITAKEKACALCKGTKQIGKNPDIPCPKCQKNEEK